MECRNIWWPRGAVLIISSNGLDQSACFTVLLCVQVGEHANDTRVLLSRLKECSDDTDLAVSMSHIRGPWAFVYYQVNVKGVCPCRIGLYHAVA